MSCDKELELAVYNFIRDSDSRTTFKDISVFFKEKNGTGRLLIKNAVNSLLEKNKIVYSYNLGNTFLEISYNKAVRVSRRFILLPENLSIKKSRSDVPIRLQKGASFGTGSHPTTRICLNAIDFIFDKRDSIKYALDIGTGSGVLAIAASLMGADKVYATDIHEVALCEAKKNICFNNIGDKIEVSLKTPEELKKEFSLIMANLRFPTLIELYDTFMKYSEDGAYLAFSGIREDEADRLTEKYKRCELVKRWDDMGWSGLCLKKRS